MNRHDPIRTEHYVNESSRLGLKTLLGCQLESARYSLSWCMRVFNPTTWSTHTPTIFDKDLKKTSFKKTFPQKNSRHVKSNFVNFEETTSPSCQNYLAETRKSTKKTIFLSKKNSTRSSFGHVGFFFDRIAEKIRQKNNFFDKIPTTLAQKIVFRSKLYNSPLSFLNN